MKTVSTFWTCEEDLESLRSQVEGMSCNGLLIQVFWGRQDREAIPQLQAQLRRLFPDAAVIGTTTAGEIHEGAAHDDRVLVSLSCFERIIVRTAWVENQEMRSAGAQLAAQLGETERPALMIAFLNGHLNGEAFAHGVGQHDRRLTLAGGLAGDGTRFQHTRVFDADRVVRNGAVAVGLYGDFHFTQHINFNWHPIGPRFQITRSDGNIVYEINNMPAQAFYARYLGEEAVNYLPGIAMEFPLIFERHGEPVARACLKVLPEGAMLYAGEVPQGQKAQFGVGAHHQILQDSCRQSRQLATQPVESIFIYSCVARRQLLQDNIIHELRPLQSIAPAVGFFTYGELAHLKGGNTLLNQTMTVLAISEGEVSSDRLPSCTMPTTDFKDVMLRAMAHLATQVSQDLERLSQKYRDLAEHDLLTGLYNRRAGEQLLHKEMARAVRHDFPLSVVILDMDHFKRINDTYGHAAGDHVLRHWAQFLVRQLRNSDFVIRWGGEEVLLILPMTRRQDARKRLELLIEQFAAEQLETGGHRIGGLSFSGGVAQLRPEDTLDSLLERADHALYRAKAAGRGCIMI